MTSHREERGTSLVELVAGLGLAIGIAVVAVGSIATGLRLLVGAALRLESDDLAAQATEAFTFDVRRAGFDPRATGLDALLEAQPDRLAVVADLDGDGAIDVASEESTTYACDLAGGRFSRILGGQSLPLANGVTACLLRFHDGHGNELVPPPGGLDAGERRRVRLVALDLAMAGGGLAVASTARAATALRGLP